MKRIVFRIVALSCLCVGMSWFLMSGGGSRKVSADEDCDGDLSMSIYQCRLPQLTNANQATVDANSATCVSDAFNKYSLCRLGKTGYTNPLPPGVSLPDENGGYDITKGSGPSPESLTSPMDPDNCDNARIEASACDALYGGDLLTYPEYLVCIADSHYDGMTKEGFCR